MKGQISPGEKAFELELRLAESAPVEKAPQRQIQLAQFGKVTWPLL